VQRTFAMLALAVAVTSTAQGQTSWQSEIGIQGGFVRVKPAGTGRADQIDVFAVPGANYVLGLLTQGSVYAIIPASEKLAVEPSFVVSQLNAGTTNTTGRLGLRADYALTPKFYAAAGGVLLYIHAGSQQSKTLGLQGAVGYRMHLTGPLNARIEGNVSATKRTKNLTPFDSYGVLFGVSTRLHGTPAPAAARRASVATTRAWRTAIGIQGGYLSSHSVGTGQDVTGLSFPGLGGSVSGIGGGVLSGPATMFVILPIGSKTAVEGGLDIVRVQQAASGQTGFSGNFSGRLNYAVKNNWYAAAGANLNYLKYTAAKGTITGANLAWGYRFGLGGNFGGRVELNYSLFGKNTKLTTPAQNVVGLMVGATLPLK
jgi:hypothetical protein